MRALAFCVAVAACGGSSPAPAHAPSSSGSGKPAAPATNLVVMVTADAIVAGDLRITAPDDPYAQFTALRDSFAAQLHGAAHPAIAIAADARGDAALLAIAALIAAGADHVDVRAQADQHRVCDVARPPARPTEAGGQRAELSVLVTPDTAWVGSTGGTLQHVEPAALAAAVATIGSDAAFHDRTDAEIAVDRDVPAGTLLDAIAGMCPRFPALRIVAPDGLSVRPTM